MRRRSLILQFLSNLALAAFYVALFALAIWIWGLR